MPPFDLDVIDSSYKRPAAVIRIFGPDNELLDVIEIPEVTFTVSPESEPQQPNTTRQCERKHNA